MTIENIILSVCEEMTAELTPAQVDHLKTTLFIKFHGLEIREECTAVQTAESAEEERMLDYFKASKVISGRSAGTIEQYVREVRILRETCGKPLKAVTSMDIRWYFGVCRTRRGNSMATIQNKRRFLNSFFSFLFREGFIDCNPVEKIEPMKVEQRLKRAFTTEELERLRGGCGTNYRDRALMEFLLSTGVRVSELCSLKVMDINFGDMSFPVIGKGNKQRICYINETGSFYLLRYLHRRMEQASKTRAEIANEPLFVTSKAPHDGLSVRGVQKVLGAIGKTAGVEDVHPHKFRRTYASTLAARGCPIQDLRVLMGHSNVDTTMIYCDIRQENINLSYRRYGKEA